MELNRFMLKCASICPETTHQKLESQHVYLILLSMNLYVKIRVKICSGSLLSLGSLIFTGSLG